LTTAPIIKRLLICALALAPVMRVNAQEKIRNFIFFNLDRERIQDSLFLNTKNIAGAQLKYTWRTLEPELDAYDFTALRHDLDYLNRHGKALFIQLQDVSFDTAIINVPRYILEEQQYHGGVNLQYEFADDKERVFTPAGWVARRWDPAVAERFQKLLRQLGKEFDGKIEGINLPETAVDFGEKGNLHPPGFTFETYKNAVIANMKALKAAFPKSLTIQYVNFMPGEFLPWTDRSYLREIFAYAKKIGVGVGNPDLLVYKKGQMNNSYGFIKECSGLIPTGVAVQWGNYEHVNPQTGKQVTVPQIYEFGKNYLGLRYIFWSTQEPYYSKDVIGFLNKL
jgi:hypothetical protein